MVRSFFFPNFVCLGRNPEERADALAASCLNPVPVILTESREKAREKYQVCLVAVLWVFLVCYSSVPQRSKLSKILGETIRAERIKAGLSQEQLAEKANLARNYIGNIERAEYKVTVETLARIANALGVRVRDLVNDL